MIEKQQETGNHKIFFHLKTLTDIFYELNLTDDIEKTAETVLLTIMGMFGIAQGFVLIVDDDETHLINRGWTPEQTKTLYKNSLQLRYSYFPDKLEIQNRLFLKKSDSFPPETEIAIQWATEKTCGFLGFGKKITSEAYSDTDIQFLLCFSNILTVYIQKTEYIQSFYNLNSEISEKNSELEKILSQADYTQKKLDKRVYHLSTLYDTLIELSGLTDTKKISETFLLMVLGALSVNQAYILLCDKSTNKIQLACRGMEKEKFTEYSYEKIEKYIADIFKTSHKISEVKISTAPEVNLDFNTSICLFFAPDENSYGILGLGKKITGEDYLENEQEMLVTLINNFILFLKNARSFEMIKALNENLEKRNTELEKTIEELKASRYKIEVLERAKNHIKSVIQREAERAGKVSLTDIAVILIAGLVLGLIFNFANPGGIDIIPSVWHYPSFAMISQEDAKLKYDMQSAVFVDARPSNFFDQRHIKNAVNLPLALFDFVYMMKFANIEPDKELIVYGTNISKPYDKEVAFKLLSRNHKNVKILSGGFSEWKKRAYPGDEVKNEQE